MPKAELITQAEYARRRGCDPTSVRDAVRAGRITLIEGKIDPAVADVQWQRNTRTRAGTPANDANLSAPPAPTQTEPLGEDYWSSRARREKAEADLAELKLAEQRGELVRADAVRSAVSKRAAGLREALLQIPSRLAAVVAAETSQARCHELLEAELHQVLAQLVES